MRMIDGAGHFGCNAQRFVDRQLSFANESRPQRFALDVGHHVIECAVRLPRIVDREDVRVAEVGYELDLSPEPFGSERKADVVAQDFDGDLSIELEILGEVDRGKGPVTELTLDLVAGSDGRAQALERGWHAHTSMGGLQGAYNIYSQLFG